MKKYWTVFKISWQKQLEYRFNFFLGRLRNIIVLLLLYYVWYSLTYATGEFAGWTSAELMTYVFGANILRSIIFGAQSRETAQEINDGAFSIFLVKPVSHFAYVFFRELAERSVNFATAIIEVFIFAAILKIQFIWQTDWRILLMFIISSVFALFLYFVLSYLVSLIAFWSREAMGPRFLFEWILEFASGAYFPLDILNRAVFIGLACLPFMYLMYLPLGIYLGKFALWQMAAEIAAQFLWIIIIGILARAAWSRGLKKFTGEGM